MVAFEFTQTLFDRGYYRPELARRPASPPLLFFEQEVVAIFGSIGMQLVG